MLDIDVMVDPLYEMVPSPVIGCTILVLYLLIRFLRVFSHPDRPRVYTKEVEDSKKPTIYQVLKNCKILDEKYNPPALWGRNGHLQTAVYGVLGHSTLKRSFDKRHTLKLTDGTTVTFDVFEPTKPHPSGQDYTMALCPGICNHSESNYIRTCVHNAQENGYRCAVLNHLGALANIPVTSPRLFSYGNTAELMAMMETLGEVYPQTRFIQIGFSMGANITTLYLHRTSEELRKRTVVGLSVCQGYDADKSGHLFHDWECGRRVYNYIITENVKRLLRRNFDAVVAPHVKTGVVDEQRLFSATSVLGLDEHYTRRILGYNSVEEMYKDASSFHKIPKIRIPTVFINSADDPLFPQQLWGPVREVCSQSDKHAFVLMKHGGHLGFLEGWSMKPSSVTWLDKFIVELANSATGLLDSEQN
ncbi:unnamed protein product [Bursaphelenchus okinawaensis]|uniref:AB hydrolase-1 domain-containing protein n=1 Tax=Bursaphelenchus okinawaensis TaxID=465554 RepID=A0A811JR54_9BILA|nr:unnamed protein product [Bursaphelenchus okinawaensis]CAG9078446.1 unnamed protein product [Bursaphelenchus okinawaensis]